MIDAVVARLESQGLTFGLEGGRPWVSPAQALGSEDRVLLKIHLAELVAYLRGRSKGLDQRLEELCREADPNEAVYFREERAAILEYDAGFTRGEAEALAGLNGCS